jgi:hypothetical protein
LREANLTYCFVVEPAEKEIYKATGSKIMVLPESGQGITYSRDWIMKQMRHMGYKWFWMLDDDIECFGESFDGKTKQTDAGVLEKSWYQFRFYPPASLYSLELRQFSWSASEIQKDKIAMQCVLFNLENCKNIDYDIRLKIREDYDLSLQAIFRAKGTLRSGKYFYGIADMKSQPGGMSEWYNEETEMHETWKLCRKWPEIVEPLRKEGRIDVKINWKKIK